MGGAQMARLTTASTVDSAVITVVKSHQYIFDLLTRYPNRT